MGILVLKQKQTTDSHQTEIYSYDEIPFFWLHGFYSVSELIPFFFRTLAIHYIHIFINDIMSAESDIISNICFDIIVYLCFLSIFTNFQIKETFVSSFFL